FFFQAEDGIRDFHVTGVQTCALPISYHAIEDWRNFSAKAESIVKNDDLIVMVSARRDTISYQDNMENLPYRLSRQFTKNSFLVLYPQQTNYNSGTTNYQNF